MQPRLPPLVGPTMCSVIHIIPGVLGMTRKWTALPPYSIGFA